MKCLESGGDASEAVAKSISILEVMRMVLVAYIIYAHCVG